MKNYRDVLGLEANTTVEGFEAQINRTREFLADQTADVSFDPVMRNGNELQIPVRITNKTGHKLPTGYPSRRVWVHLRVTDAAGNTVFESGQPDANGRLSVDATHLQSDCLSTHKDTSGTDYSHCFEPHRSTIDTEDQVAVYESVLGDVYGNITYVLLYADHYLKDNRIPPRGFVRSAVVNGVTGIAGAAANDPDFNAEDANGGSGQDIVHYNVNVDGYSGPFRAEARLLYQAVRPGFVYGLHSSNARVERYKTMYEQLPPSVERLSSATVSGIP